MPPPPVAATPSPPQPAPQPAPQSAPQSDRGAGVPATASFAALRVPGYRLHFGTFIVAMMADNIEHVISYWVMYQRFHSEALGGFAVVSHWLPYLLLSLPVGALAERVDLRRVIQAGMLLFVGVSLAWAWLFHVDALTQEAAMLLLVLHGVAGVLWMTPSQLLLHDIVAPHLLPSAVRLNATARYLGILVGPAVGGGILLGLGAVGGMALNTVFYLPLLLWLWKAPYGPRFSVAHTPPRPMRSLADVRQAVRDVASNRLIVGMTLLAGAASFFVGNSYQAQMPGFAHDLGHGDPGVAYSMLLAADAAGALTAGVALERLRLFRTLPRTAVLLALAWCAALAGFSMMPLYVPALMLLFLAGFFELSFNSMAQAIVQVNAPAALRGRIIGLYSMSSLGLRSFSGLTVGMLGSVTGVHWSLAAAAGAMALVLLALLRVVAAAA